MYGTLSTLDDLSGVQDSVLAFGERALAARFATALAIHNAAMANAISDFATVTSANQLPYGDSAGVIIAETDQYGVADASKPGLGANVGFPLRQYTASIQWTKTFLMTNSVGKVASTVDAAAAADRRNVTKQIQRALFRNTNTASYLDINASQLTYALKALLNADGTMVPDGPNGETFDGGTHTHYVTNASLTAAKVVSTIDTVVEHGVTGSVRLYVSKTDEAAVRGLTGFTAYVDARIQTNATPATPLDVNNPSNRAIGVFDGAEVWVKQWVPASYLVAFDTGAGDDKAIAVRTRDGSLTGTGAFQIVSEIDDYPLRSDKMLREFGVSAYQRQKAAVLYTGNTTYAIPAGF